MNRIDVTDIEQLRGHTTYQLGRGHGMFTLPAYIITFHGSTTRPPSDV